MENLVDWKIVLQLGPIALMGLIVHLLEKWDSARKKPYYLGSRFLKENWPSYAIAFIVCFVGLIFIANGIELLPLKTKVVVAFAIGVTGGSLVRSFVTRKNQ